MADFIIVAAAIVLVAVIAVSYVRRVGSGGCACGCSNSERAPKPKRVEVADTDEAHYPYAAELIIGGMSCEGCARNVENALNALEGTWARVDSPEDAPRVNCQEEFLREAYLRAKEAMEERAAAAKAPRVEPAPESVPELAAEETAEKDEPSDVAEPVPEPAQAPEPAPAAAPAPAPRPSSAPAPRPAAPRKKRGRVSRALGLFGQAFGTLFGGGDE